MFRDRKDAGIQLAQKLSMYANKKDALILAIPRGGVAVAYEAAKRLNLPLDIVVIKKIGFPGNEELALGAAGADSHYINEEIAHDVPQQYVREQIKIKQMEVKKRYELLRGKKPMYNVKNKAVIVIDDGIATGATMQMAVQILKKQSPKEVIIAIPVAPPEAVRRLQEAADNVICVLQPKFLLAIGEFYQDFAQVEDEEAMRLLKEANK